jgi:hypothetical protein
MSEINQHLAAIQQEIGKEFSKSPSPFTHWLKPVVKGAEAGSLIFEYRIRKDMTNPMQVLHGGVSAGIIDDIIGATVFTMTANVSKLSGDMFPTSNTFITGTSATGFGTPTSLSYESAGVTGVPLPLTRNLYVSSDSAQVTTSVNITSGFGSTSSAPSLTGQNSYTSGTSSFTLGATVLYKTATISSETTNKKNENNLKSHLHKVFDEELFL